MNGEKFEVEPEIGPLDLLKERVFERWGKNSLLTPEIFQQLVGSVDLRDLSEHEVGKRYGVELLGLADMKEGMMLDKRFTQLTEQQQDHVFNHEFGHFFEHFIKKADRERWQHLDRLIGQIAGSQTSHYSSVLAEQSGEQDPRVTQEKWAEVTAQYLTSDGTFKGFILNKAVTFPKIEDSNRQEYYERLAEDAHAMDYFLAGDDPLEAREVLNAYPQLESHFQLWSELRNTLQDPELITLEQLRPQPETTSLLDEGEDIDDLDLEELYLEYEEMVTHFPTEPAAIESNKQKKFTANDLAVFFKLFP